MELPTTPKVALLLERLNALNLEVTKNMNQLTKRLAHLEEPLVLRPAKENIVDKKKDKQRHKKSWKVEVKDILNTPIEFEEVKFDSSAE